MVRDKVEFFTIIANIEFTEGNTADKSSARISIHVNSEMRADQAWPILRAALVKKISEQF